MREMLSALYFCKEPVKQYGLASLLVARNKVRPGIADIPPVRTQADDGVYSDKNDSRQILTQIGEYLKTLVKLQIVEEAGLRNGRFGDRQTYRLTDSGRMIVAVLPLSKKKHPTRSRQVEDVRNYIEECRKNGESILGDSINLEMIEAGHFKAVKRYFVEVAKAICDEKLDGGAPAALHVSWVHGLSPEELGAYYHIHERHNTFAP
jgi:hypothetical protein